jgi:hypothetical protein
VLDTGGGMTVATPVYDGYALQKGEFQPDPKLIKMMIFVMRLFSNQRLKC